MSARRPPAPPPTLAGFTFVEVLGSGGFADVYLYEQQLPRRRVAVKVLLADRLDELSASQFTDEANVMAMLSTHPAIVTIYQAGVARDGRPYLVMEYCPKPNLQARYRQEPFSVAEALRTGIQVAAAVETAHRAGVLHRDIKPANILVTEYNRPALTDFGIAAQAGDLEQAQGLSVPWSPPEAFADAGESGPRSDVWSLGATVYSLLSGRSPFEQPGGNNSTTELMRRIEVEPVPGIGRADVPGTLTAVLNRAMAKVPGDRFDSAVAFARALQKVQIELSHSVTPLDIVDDSPVVELEDETDDGTRVRGVAQIQPQQDPPRAQRMPDAATTRRRPEPNQITVPSAVATRQSPVPSNGADVEATLARPVTPVWQSPDPIAPVGSVPGVSTLPSTSPSAPPPAPPSTPPSAAAVTPEAGRRPRVGLWVGIGLGVLVLLVGVITATTLISQNVEPEVEESPTSTPIDVLQPGPSPVEDLVGEVHGDQVHFTWTNPKPEDGDVYLWRPVTLEGDEEKPSRLERPEVTVDQAAGGTTCIEVHVVRSDGRMSDATRGCV